MNNTARSSVSSVSYAESPGEGANLHLGNHSSSHFLTAREFQNVYLGKHKPKGQPQENPVADIPSTPVLPRTRARSAAMKKRSLHKSGASTQEGSYLSAMLQQHNARTAKLYENSSNPVVSMSELLDHAPARQRQERRSPARAVAHMDFGNAATAAWGAVNSGDDRKALLPREAAVAAAAAVSNGEEKRKRHSLPQQLRERIATAPLEGNLPLVRLLRAELEAQRTKIDELEKEVDKYKSMVEETEALPKEGESSSNVQLRRKVATLQRKLSDMTAQNENLKRINRSSNARELTIALQAAEAEIQRLRSGTTPTTHATRACSGKAADRKEDRDAEQLRTQNLSLLADLQESASVKNALETSLADVQRQLAEKTAEKNEVQAYAKQIASQYGEAVSQALQDRAALKQVIVENEFLGKEVEVLRRLPQEVTHLRAELERIQASLAQAEAQAKRLKDSVEEAKKPDPAVAFLQEDKTRLVALLRQKNVQESSLRGEIGQLRHYQSSVADMKATAVLDKEKMLSKDREKYLLGVIASLREQADILAREVEQQKQERLKDLEEAQEREEDDLIQKILEKRPNAASATTASTTAHISVPSEEKKKEQKTVVTPPVAPKIEPLPLDDNEDSYTPVGTPIVKQTPPDSQKLKSPPPSSSSSSSSLPSSPEKSGSDDAAVASDKPASSASSSDKEEEKDSSSTISSPPISKTPSSLSEEDLPSIAKEKDSAASLSVSHNSDSTADAEKVAETTDTKKSTEAQSKEIEEEEEEEISSADNSYLEPAKKDTPKAASPPQTPKASTTGTPADTTPATEERHRVDLDLPQAPVVMAAPVSILISRDNTKPIDFAPAPLRATVFSPAATVTEDPTTRTDVSESSLTESSTASSPSGGSETGAAPVPAPPPAAAVPVPVPAAHPSATPTVPPPSHQHPPPPRPHPEKAHASSSTVPTVEPELVPQSPPMASRVDNSRSIPSPPTALTTSLQETSGGSPQMTSVIKSLHGTEEVQWKGTNVSNLVSELYHQYSGDASFDFFEPLAARYRKEEEERQSRYPDRVLAESGQGQLTTIQSRSSSSKEIPASVHSQASEEKNLLGDVNVLTPPQNRLHTSPEPSPIRQASGEATQMSLGEDFKAMVTDDSKVHLSSTALPTKVAEIQDKAHKPTVEAEEEVHAADTHVALLPLSPKVEETANAEVDTENAPAAATPTAAVPAPPRVAVPEETPEAAPPLPHGDLFPAVDDTSSTHTAPYEVAASLVGGSSSFNRPEPPRRDGASPPISEATHVGEDDADEESVQRYSPTVPMPALPPPPPPTLKSVVEAVAPTVDAEPPAPLEAHMEEKASTSEDNDTSVNEGAPEEAVTQNEEPSSIPADLPPLPPPPAAVVPEPPSNKEEAGRPSTPHSGDLMGSLSLSATTPEGSETVPGKRKDETNEADTLPKADATSEEEPNTADTAVAAVPLGLPPLPPMVTVPPPPSASGTEAASEHIAADKAKEELTTPVSEKADAEAPTAAEWPPLPPKVAVPVPPSEATSQLSAPEDKPEEVDAVAVEKDENAVPQEEEEEESGQDGGAAIADLPPLPPMVAVPQPPPETAPSPNAPPVKEVHADEGTDEGAVAPEENDQKATETPVVMGTSHQPDNSSLGLEGSSDDESKSVNSADTLDPK